MISGEGVLHAPVCVPDNPHRIVVLDPTFTLGMTIELGLPVIGAPLFGMSDENLRDKAVEQGVEDLGAVTQPNIERIIALQPDLIIGSGMLDPVYDMASRIAPTVLISAKWRDYYRIIGDVFGKSAEVTEMFDALDTRIAAIRDKAPDVTVSMVRITSWDFQVYLDAPDAYAPFAVLSEAGIKRSDYETSVDGSTLKRPDWEDLAQLNGDILLYIVGGTNASATNGRHEEVIENPLWKMLPAVEAGRVYRVDPAIWMEFSGVGSANAVLDDVERYIISRP
ncbi:iron-siderophore ABC transporter substrate-binding protein [Hoeflea sp. CAU 1731]